MPSNPTSERMVVEKASYSLFQEHVNRYIFANQFVEQRRVLDVACGSGYGTLGYAQQGKASQVIGVDLSWEACCQTHSYGLDVVMADASRLPFQNACFEVIVSFETIEHLPFPQDFLSECQRLLEIGGEFVISTPNRQMSIFQDNPYHFREYRPQEFIDLLQSFFSSVQTYGQLYRYYPIRWLRRVGGKILGFTEMGHKIIVLAQRYLFGTRPLQQTDLSLIDEAYKVIPAETFNQKFIQPDYVVCVAKKLATSHE